MDTPQEPPPEGSAPIPPGGPVGSSPAPGEPTPPPPPPPPRPAGDDGKANVGLRIGAVVLALALAIICAVGIAVMVDVADTGVCSEIDLSQVSGAYECYDFSESIKPVVLGAGWIGSVLAGVAAILALAFTIRGRGGRVLLATTGAAAFFLATSIIAAQV